MRAQTSCCTKRQPLLRGLSHRIKSILSPFLVLMLASCVNGADIDVNKLLLKAKEQNKPLMFFHHIPGCPYCKAMLDENFKDAKLLKEIAANFLHVEIYTANLGTVRYQDFKGSTKEFSSHIGAFVYPSTIFMTPEGEVIHSAIGYRNIDEYFAEITYVSSGNYKTMGLEEHKLKIEMEDF